VVIASAEGDVHDLGKNIFKMILVGNGFKVVDCGKDCPLEDIIQAAEAERPLAVGISGLLTTIIPQVKRVKDMLASHGLGEVKVLAGGAALKQCSPAVLRVDFVADSAFEGARYLNALLGGQS
jgi:methanogenic corrinoid protein MtbC1